MGGIYTRWLVEDTAYTGFQGRKLGQDHRHLVDHLGRLEQILCSILELFPRGLVLECWDATDVVTSPNLRWLRRCDSEMASNSYGESYCGWLVLPVALQPSDVALQGSFTIYLGANRGRWLREDASVPY